MIFISGCKKTATNTVLSSVTLEIKPTSRALPRKYGIIGMLALRPPQRCMKKGCAWRNIWQKGRQSNEKIENVLKYAMPGTRVYLNLECENNWPVLYLRNISAESLNVRPEELTERFVRGDSSRSTEGSGLGLAIASSMCKLQNIKLNLAIDGDLFKVTLLFP